MKLLEAINASTHGHTIVSNAGKRYTPAELAAKMLGRYAARFNHCGTKGEMGD